MTKELVQETIGRPPEERAVIEEAENLLDSILSAKSSLEYHKKKQIEEQENISKFEKKIELLKQEKYKIKKAEYSQRLFVEYEEEKEE